MRIATTVPAPRLETRRADDGGWLQRVLVGLGRAWLDYGWAAGWTVPYGAGEVARSRLRHL